LSKQTFIPNIDYTDYIELVGTAHFTRRSLNDVYTAINHNKPNDVAIELDWTRFKLLNDRCAKCHRREHCNGKCEFIGATEALGNTDANIWLIDISEEEIRSRIRANLTLNEFMNRRHYYNFNLPKNPTWLWEQGFK
jgi:radical SAM protein with 4Fe4S-binding SPASM domain